MFQKNEFMAELTRKGLTVKDLAELMGIDVTSLYRKMNGESDFYRNEINDIRGILGLNDTDTGRIFFAQ